MLMRAKQGKKSGPQGLTRDFDLLARAPGGVARLRELILALAVQGKLVAQDASDEPANRLLERSRACMQVQMKKGLAKKETPALDVSDDEMTFCLPKGWTWCRLAARSFY